MTATKSFDSAYGAVRRLLVGVAVLLLMSQIGACYYQQAARGQLEIMQKRRPVDAIIEDADSPDELKQRLALVKEARQFSIDALYLPDNDSYRSYADLERDFVVWNVFAAPEFSLVPRNWCFPVEIGRAHV